MGYASTDSTQEETIQETDYSQFQSVNLELRRLLEARKMKINILDSDVADIRSRTDRMVTGKIAKPLEFMYSDGKPVKSGTSYHIHYTTEVEEYFMTGDTHSFTTRLIYPIRPITEFGIYDILNHQEPLTLKVDTVYPTKKDYEKGRYFRYFARKANDKKSSGFEISKKYFETSPLYIYVSILWYLKGTPDDVYNTNSKQIIEGSKILPFLYRILNPHQFFIPKENYTPAEIVKQRLGIEISKEDSWKGESKKERHRRIRREEVQQVETADSVEPGGSGGGY